MTERFIPAKIAPYRTLDAWRGLAALAVVFFHWGEMVVRGNPSLGGNPLYAACSYGYLGVQIFFVISGYCIASAAMATIRRGEGPFAFMKARVRRIYPTYWAGLVLTFVFYFVGYLLAKHNILHANIYTEANPFTSPWVFYATNISLTMYWFDQPGLLAVAWTLSFEIAFYVVVAVVFAILSVVGWLKHLLTALHVLTIVSLIWLILSQSNFPGCPFPFYMWPQFGLGVLVYDMTANPNHRLPRLLGGAALGLLIYFVGKYDVEWIMHQPQRLTFLVAAGFAVLLCLVYRFDRKVSDISAAKVIAFCGTFSYSLYLTQVISLRLFNQATGLLHFPQGLHLLVFPVAIAFSVASAYLFFLMFERPVVMWGKNRRPSQLPFGATVEPPGSDTRSEVNSLMKKPVS